VPPPPALTSATFTRDFNLTKAYGALNSSVRTAAQTEIGRFWADHPAAQYSRALRGLVESQGLDTADAARLGAMSFVALADSATACMNAKYHYFFWRPLTAIRNADSDGNTGTVADPNWVPLDVTPQHPEYPANHGCVTQALMDTLTAFFDIDEIPYSVTSTVTGTTHSFDSFEDVVEEVDNARIPYSATSSAARMRYASSALSRKNGPLHEAAARFVPWPGSPRAFGNPGS
jgi:hypothetical protein